MQWICFGIEKGLCSIFSVFFFFLVRSNEIRVLITGSALANVTLNRYDGFYGERSRGMSSADQQNPFIKANMVRANCEISRFDRGDFDLVFSEAMLSYQLGR